MGSWVGVVGASGDLVLPELLKARKKYLRLVFRFSASDSFTLCIFAVEGISSRRLSVKMHPS